MTPADLAIDMRFETDRGPGTIIALGDYGAVVIELDDASLRTDQREWTYSAASVLGMPRL